MSTSTRQPIGTLTSAIVTIHDAYLLDLVRKALATENLVLNEDVTTASGTTFFWVGPDAATLDEARARTAAGNND